eukprot:7330487-Prymnesium_polylepis.1
MTWISRRAGPSRLRKRSRPRRRRRSMQRGGGSREAPEGAGSKGCKSRESEGDPCAHESKNTA